MQTRPPRICLVCDFCSSDREFALGLLQIPPHDGHPCPLLTLPTAKRVVDFHHQVTAHSGQTQKRSTITAEFAAMALKVAKEYWQKAKYDDNYANGQFKMDMKRENLYRETDRRIKQK